MSEASAAHRMPCVVAPAAALAACRPYVIRYLRSLGASSEDAEDLVQDTLLVALRSMQSFRGEARFSTWLCRIARRVYAHWRAQTPPPVSLPKEEESPLAEGLEDEILLRMAICEALCHLPQPLRLLVCKHYVQGDSYRDICRGQEITKARLTNNLRAARRLLRQDMTLQGHQPAAGQSNHR